ncbi:ATP-binding protein [Thalassospira sp. UBA1131]|uniref:ATP-binding protein n=1 Tax=Thalassospira sp. UBA1131 TaxID=1947672 RepID=UPI0025F15821|nr:ATP-binding protein [Thalassospira sp. UBA1131]
MIEDVVTLRVSDNGRGMPDDFTPGTSDGLGLQLIELLADQIGGTLDITTNGETTFVINFKIGK